VKSINKLLKSTQLGREVGGNCGNNKRKKEKECGVTMKSELK